MIRRVLLLATALVLFTAMPARAQYEQGITVSGTVTPGARVGISACCFPAGSTVTFTIDDMVIGTATADDFGVASGTFLIPEDTPLGSGTIAATAVTPDGQTITESTTVTVVGVTPGVVTTARIGALPVTGTDSSVPLSVIGAALLTAGGLAMLASRRRTRASTSARR